MYIPTANRENDDPTELKRFVRTNPLSTLVSMTGKGLVASHIPVVLHDSPSGFGVLRCHIARCNEHRSDFEKAVETLAIFTGPQHYISASWYPGKQTHGEGVPTWNYVAVHGTDLPRRLPELREAVFGPTANSCLARSWIVISGVVGGSDRPRV